MTQKLFPRNLTARAVVEYEAYKGKVQPPESLEVVGNPVTTRLESGVGNCYPGLEFDQRNLDRRFFPGLVFDFLSQADAANPKLERRGARLRGMDLEDPELTPPESPPERVEQVRALVDSLAELSRALSEGIWFLESLEQGGRRINLDTAAADGTRVPMDGLAVWRLVRGMEPAEVKLTLRRRDTPAGQSPSHSVSLTGWRRRFTDPHTGVIPAVYAPGELTQSLCSPWQHDFRDCGCHYWASNHPDIVLGEDALGDPTSPSGQSDDPVRANLPLDWLRSDRNRASSAAALGDRDLNRPFQMDHYEISHRYQDLAIVLEGKEISSIYRPRDAEEAPSLTDPEAVASRLFETLAPLEHVLLLEYLYARASLLKPEEVLNLPSEQARRILPVSQEEAHELGEEDIDLLRKRLAEDVEFARHEMLLIAVSEMRHLRWANQLLWELEHAGLTKPRGPALGISKTVPVTPPAPPRPRALRPLTLDVLQSYIAVEAPSGTLDGQYAAVLSTLRQSIYPSNTYQLASRIVGDGTQHYSRFREIEAVLRLYHPSQPLPGWKPPYLRDLQEAAPDAPRAQQALELYRRILTNLAKAYERGDMEDANAIIDARQAMRELDELMGELASAGLGVPFFVLDASQ